MGQLDVGTYKCVDTETIDRNEYNGSPERNTLESLGNHHGIATSNRDGVMMSSGFRAY